MEKDLEWEIAGVEREIKLLQQELLSEKQVKQKVIENLKGIKRTTGQHPGGLLISLPEIDILDYTPLNYPAENKKAEWVTTHFEYGFLSKIFLKIDILGHNEPTLLQKLSLLTGVGTQNVNFRDKKVMRIFTESETLGIPEFGTDFVKKNFLEVIRPTKFSELVQISGFSHGTNVWTQNQQTVFKNKLLSLNQLIACREDIWKFLVSWGVGNKEAFIATEYIRKGKWTSLSEVIKKEIKEKLNDREGEIYFSILSKIEYIFPKPHAIAYTTTAWKTAYYKVYYPKEFYSVLLTCHATVYNIWLMTFQAHIIEFYLNELISNNKNYKSSQKEFFSSFKVLETFIKSKKKIENEKIAKIEEVLEKIKKKVISIESDNFLLKENFQKSLMVWKLTMKEKELLFTLKVIWEMLEKGFDFKIGIDLNNSEINDFKIQNETIYFPFNSIGGVGEKLAEKIIAFKENSGPFSADWRKELEKIFNVNHLQQFENLKKYGLLID